MCANDPDIFVLDVEGGTATNLTRHPAWEVVASWSPDGELIGIRPT